MSEKYLSHKTVDEFTDAALTEFENEGRQMADQAIQSVAERVTDEFINKIEDKELRAAAAGTMKKMDSAGELISAFKAVGGNSELLHKSVDEIQKDVQKFMDGELTRADLMVSMADTAEIYITQTVEKMATLSAAEYGALAPAVGKMAGYIAGSLFREAVGPFIRAAQRAQMARRKYEQLHGLYEEAIAQMQQQREDFERETEEMFARRQDIIDACFNNLDAAISQKNVDKASAALDEVAKEFNGGKGLKFKNFKEFDDFISNSDEELIL